MKDCALTAKRALSVNAQSKKFKDCALTAKMAFSVSNHEDQAYSKYVTGCTSLTLISSLNRDIPVSDCVNKAHSRDVTDKRKLKGGFV